MPQIVVTTINVVKELLDKDIKKIRKYEEIAYALSFYSIFGSGISMFIENDLLNKIMVGAILGSSSIALYLAIKVIQRKNKFT